MFFADKPHTSLQDGGDAEDGTSSTIEPSVDSAPSETSEPAQPEPAKEADITEAAPTNDNDDDAMERRMVQLEEAAAERRRLKEQEATAATSKAAAEEGGAGGDDAPVARAGGARASAAPVDQASKDAQAALNAEWNKSAKKAVEGVQANDPTYTVVDLSGNTVFAMKHTEVSVQDAHAWLVARTHTAGSIARLCSARWPPTRT